MASISTSDPFSLTKACHTCGTVKKTFTCIQCNNLPFCDGCWEKWVLHLPGATGWGSKPHEKVDPVLLQRLRQVLEPIRTEPEHEAELDQDQTTTWFGLDRDSSGQPTFIDYGRFAAIMNDSLAGKEADRFPQLVSFIGETGAGKSTLIKLLIDRQDLTSPGTSKYWSPITSSTQDYIPTTADVHLYADPSSFHSETPLLFADCEGLNGGEALPKALRGQSTHNTSTIGSGRGLFASVHGSQRSILWARNPETRKREYAIKHLYPKILYTFSDVVVFVMRSPRSFESTVLDKLIRWGAASLDKSLNQPVLPHAIIILNATDNVDEAEWEIEKATNSLMAAIHSAVSHEPRLQEYIQTWNEHGKDINSTKQLLECYYSSITVIRIPSRGSYMLMDRQAEKLQGLIKARCVNSHIAKRRARLLANSERMQIYLQSAYDQFTRDLDLPFDFVKEALRHNPVPRDFEGNILKLAVSIKDNLTSETVRNDAGQIFLIMSPMIASCVMFDAARQNLLGTAPQLLQDAYSELCTAALRSFADHHWPCTFRNSAYDSIHGRCCNVRTAHMKGHQNVHGKLIGYGSFESNFEADTFAPKWIQTICDRLALLQNTAFKLGREIRRSDVQIATILHRERISNFYAGLGNPSNFISHAACFSCLREFPECTLPCGHILCLSCIQAYGQKTSRMTIELNRCPLHVREPITEKPCIFALRPPGAGVRVLSLDSTGVGAIVELHVLRAIEKLLGPKLPIRIFFDLIVGTSAGGLVALGLGTRGWSVNEAISRFKTISKEVFKSRDLNHVPFLRDLTNVFHGSVYKTQPLEEALKRQFSDECLFGGSISLQQWTRVAVTSSSLFGQKATIFANYNRSQSAGNSLGYHFFRPDAPSKNIRIWEAARATFARPQFFKSFHRAETHEDFIDGTATFACPARVAHQEAQLMCNDVSARPDILLSIGAGRSVRDSTRQQDRLLASHTSRSPDTLSTDPPKTLLRSLVTKTGSHKACNDTSTEKLWDNFIKSNVALNDRWSVDDSNRYIRINPTLNLEEPKFDDVRRLAAIEQEAEEVIYQDSHRLKEIAHRLLASSFFFDKDVGSTRLTTDGYVCTGSICCRFQQSSSEMQGLGDFLRALLKGSFEPYFVIEEEDHASSPALGVVLTEAIIRNMRRGYFDLDPVEIRASKEHSSTRISLCLQMVPYASGSTSLLISGFPRQLMSEDMIRAGTY
ncbi:FabD/lysophospholipase-like protein [Xylariaceae sp. AK1471]|nr:FabD/lysophospholipase-like protein [Xylariaceae sp. AK1471]